MKTPPDIYAEEPNCTLEYQIAVMQACAEGKPIMARRKIPGFIHSGLPDPANAWQRCFVTPVFDWSMVTYRIDPACKPKIAEGHNPERLTEDQVGVKDGWRLLTPEEIRYRKSSAPVETSDAQTLRKNTLPVHWETYPVYGSNICTTYRTQKPAGFFLPKPKVKVPLAIKEYTAPTIWLRSKLAPGEERLVVAVVGSSGTLADALGRWHNPELLASGWEHSTDRVNWKPCYKEVEQ